MKRIAKQILKIAKQLIADADYIYDPDHKKKPAGGQVKNPTVIFFVISYKKGIFL